VSEKLPEFIKDIPHPHSKDIWVFHKEYEAQVGYYSKEQGWVIYGSYETKDKYQDLITHWKPIILPDQALKGVEKICKTCGKTVTDPDGIHTCQQPPKKECTKCSE